MRDATYVIVALALCMVILLVVMVSSRKPEPPPLAMMDLADFKTLPIELKTALRRMLPDPDVIRQKWSSMTPGQKQMAIQQIGGIIPHPRPSPRHHHAEVPEASEVIDVEVPVIETESSPMKKGFLLGNDSKKKNTSDKKKNKVVTFSGVAPEGTSSGAARDDFIGADE